MHLWLVAVLAVLWNAGGAYDYSMTQMGDPAYLAQFTAEQRAYFAGFPAWADAAWAFGVWGALAGSVLLLSRSRFAVPAFAVALGGLAVSTARQFAVEMPESLDTPFNWVFTGAIWIVTVALLWYANRMTARGVSR